MSATDHRAALGDALAALEPAPEGDYAWFGERHPGGPPDILAWRLAHRLYLDFYRQGSAVPASNRSLSAAAVARTDLIPALTEANLGRGAASRAGASREPRVRR